MLTPTEIKKKATRKYSEFLKAVLTRQPFFPLSIKGAKGNANTPLETLFPALKLLLEGAKDKIGFGYEVSLKTVNTRHAGAISMPDDIYFDNIEDYLQYIGKEKEFIRFQKTILPSLRKLPQLATWVESNPLKVIKQLDQWTDLVKVCQYFQANPQANCYIRELPIEVSPTFILEHQTILSELLDLLIPPQQRTDSPVFEKRFGLSYDEPMIRVRLLDSAVIADLPTFVNDISLSSIAFQQLTIAAETVFLIDNKACFLAFPKQKNSIALWTGNLTPSCLQALAVLQSKQLYFWADLSPIAFEKLSQIRHFFQHTQSLLMNQKTLTTFEKQAIQQKNTNLVEHLSNLNTEERECFLFLKNSDNFNALEQVQITQQYLIQTLGKI